MQNETSKSELVVERAYVSKEEGLWKQIIGIKMKGRHIETKGKELKLK